jgi:hypothetical protein
MGRYAKLLSSLAYLARHLPKWLVRFAAPVADNALRISAQAPIVPILCFDKWLLGIFYQQNFPPINRSTVDFIFFGVHDVRHSQDSTRSMQREIYRQIEGVGVDQNRIHFRL